MPRAFSYQWLPGSLDTPRCALTCAARVAPVQHVADHQHPTLEKQLLMHGQREALGKHHGPRRQQECQQLLIAHPARPMRTVQSRWSLQPAAPAGAFGMPSSDAEDVCSAARASALSSAPCWGSSDSAGQALSSTSAAPLSSLHAGSGCAAVRKNLAPALCVLLRPALQPDARQTQAQAAASASDSRWWCHKVAPARSLCGCGKKLVVASSMYNLSLSTVSSISATCV
jgi:hypothetical protein